jgi:hypothetical protein
MSNTGLSFEIPARDSLGREHVEGHLVVAEAALQLYWRFRDRTFRGGGDDMNLIEVAYTSIGSAIVKTTFGFFKPRLLITLTDPRPFGEIPGTRVGTATLFLTGRGAAAEARRLLKLMDYHRSETMALERIERLSELNDRSRI